MVLQLPPLNPLRAFEAAARNGSIMLAAAEMNVTAGAVSHQIRVLEEALNVSLFRRSHRRIDLTEAGERYFGSVGPLMREIGHATEQIRPHRRVSRLQICGYATFTMRWLIPRLSEFHRLHPGVEVRIRTSMEDIDFSRSNYDGAIRSGINEWPGLRSVRLAPISFVPVCSPQLAVGSRPIIRPADLLSQVLLHSMARPDAWRKWLLHAGHESLRPTRGLMFDNSGLCYQAAIQGAGVAIAQEFLVYDDLAAGRLVKLFEPVLNEGEAYYFVSSKSKRSAALALFEDWLQSLTDEATDTHHGSFEFFGACTRGSAMPGLSPA